MPKLNLKLGEEMDDRLISAPMSPSDKIYYPNFRITADEKPELPHEGTMTIKFRKTASEMREDDEGEAHYSCTIEVHEVIDAYPKEGVESPARNRSKETGEALDTLRDAKRKEKSDAY